MRNPTNRRYGAAVLGLAVLSMVVSWPRDAQAYTTRIHIVLANEVIDRLNESADLTIPLRFGNYRVELGVGDAQAMLDHPEAFRAGSIGPDNFIFPAMTDPSHAIHLDPYAQCEELYEAAILPVERAYAIGCFLHGASDAIVHHLVNYLTGETFTINPISEDRQESMMNVVRHILAESMIQNAALTLDAPRFSAANLAHTIPKSFALRVYMREDSAVWQLMSAHAVPRFEAAKAADPNGNLQDWVLNSGLAAADHMVMIPRYLRESDVAIEGIRTWIQAEVARMQDHGDPADGSVLLVGPGSDGVLGTGDDTTDCSVTCPTTYATYFTYVGMLVPRQDAAGFQLPPAFDKVAADLRLRLWQFLPAYIQTVQNFSDEFNTELTPGDPGLNLEPATLTAAFGPLTDWSDRLVTIDYITVAQSVLPSWVLTLDSWLDNLGINLGIEQIVQAIIQPYVDQVNAILYDYVIGRARTYLEEIKTIIDQEETNINDEYMSRFIAAAPPALNGDTMLDHIYDSGLWGHSYNISAAAFAQHGLVLPDPADPYLGPVSFDASYGQTWMQAGVCAHLQEAILPFGLDLTALLTVEVAGTVHPALGSEDAPIECHDGSLNTFDTSPDSTSCAVVDLDALIASGVGSVSRAYPPDVVGEDVSCRNLYVPGLPMAPVTPDAGAGVDAGAGTDAGTDADAGGGSDGANKGGCQAAGSSQGAPLVLLLFVLVLGVRRWRRARWLVAMLAAGALTLSVSCGPGSSNGDNLDGGLDAAQNDDAAQNGDATVQNDAFVIPVDADTRARDQLIADIGDSVWSGTVLRDGLSRVVELHFQSGQQLWAELQNPFGPARKRELRVFEVQLDGATVESVVINDDLWPFNPENGRSDSWTFEITAGTPRSLRLTRGTVVEDYLEESWPAPTTGMTAEVRTFPAGSSSTVANAFCISGLNGFDYPVFFDFARGVYDGSFTQEQDFRIGSSVYGWPGGPNFAVTDIDGMRDNGGTHMTEQANFFVRYRGQVDHPGGDFCMREANDSVEDGVWVFLGSDIGSVSDNDLFLEVQGFAWWDATSDEPCDGRPAGPVEVEVIIARCAVAIEDVDVEISLNGSNWQALGDVLTFPEMNPTLLPPAL